MRFRNWSEETKTITLNTVYAFLIKGLALIISFFSTPIFIRYFHNNEVLGLWYTLLSVLTWFLTFDFGVGNGIRNHLVNALVDNDRIKVRKLLSSGISSIGGITIILFGIGYILISATNLNKFFNISESIINSNTLHLSTMIVFGAIMLRFLLTTVNSIFYAIQKSAINNLLALIISALQLIYILVFKFEDPADALLNISYAYLIISNLPVILAGLWIFSTEFKDCRPHWNYIDLESTTSILGIGTVFFFCQIFYLVIANTNEFFVSHYWNPLYAADYSFYYKITMLLSMCVSLALTPTWSMITKAYAERNYAWLNKLYKTFKITGLIIVLLQFAIVPFLQPIMDIWLGEGVLKVNFIVAIAFACFGASFLYSSMLSTIVCGLAKMKLQLCCFGIGAIAKIAFIALLASKTNNWHWVVWCNVLILIPYCILQQIRLNHIFKANEKI